MNNYRNVLFKFFKNKKEVIFAYCFGSVVKGTDNKMSDLDVAIYLDESKIPQSGSFGYQGELILEIEQALQRKVDLVILNKAPLYLAHQIISEGILVFSRCNRKRADFHFRTVRDYLDFKPFIKVQNEYLRKRLREGLFGGM